MIRNIHLLIIGMLCVGSFCYSSSSLISDCITYENSSSLKWCRYSNTTSSGYKCTTSEYNSACGGSSSYRCSTDSSYLPSNAKKLLCPEDYSNCYCNKQL